jgi:hypothetical protein
MTTEEFVSPIKQAGQPAVVRDSLYGVVKEWDTSFN